MRNKMNPSFIWLLQSGLAILFLLSGCFTAQKQREYDEKIIMLQANIVELERKLEGNSQEKGINQKLAASSSSFEKVSADIRSLRGEIDRLKVAIATGKLPGEPDSAPSIGAQLTAINARLDRMEGVGLDPDLKDGIPAEDEGSGEKTPKKTESSPSEEKKTSPKISVNTLKKGFEDKRYKYVVQNAPDLIKKLKGAQKKEASFLHAESLYKIGELKNAALAYDVYVNLSPKSAATTAHALMRLGDCFRHLGDKATAKIYYKDLISKYPKSTEARSAKERLEKELK